jgi:hypothetical protein
MRKTLLVAAAIVAAATTAAAEYAPPMTVTGTSGTAAAAEAAYKGPPGYSVVRVVRDSRACWPAVSNNCITLTRGEEVVVHGRVTAHVYNVNPRRGEYCLRPIRLSDVQCYFAPLTAIETDDSAPVPSFAWSRTRSGG